LGRVRVSQGLSVVERKYVVNRRAEGRRHVLCPYNLSEQNCVSVLM
jgi:hypothetical protein